MSAEDIIAAAGSLPPAEQWQLVTKLWANLPPEAWPPPSDEDLAMIDQRFAEIDAGLVETVSLEEVRKWMHQRVGRHG
jgi:putative addiction module component (TIGR02574 family)